MPRHEHRLAVVRSGRVAAERGVGDDAQPARARHRAVEGLAATLAVDDDAVERAEQLPPQLLALGGSPREQIVRGEDERAALRRSMRRSGGLRATGRAGHPGTSTPAAPCRMDAPAPSAAGAAARAERAGTRAGRRPRGARTRRPWHLPEAEARRGQLDIDPGPGERRGERVVVLRRERGWVGEDDAQGGRTVVPDAGPELEPVPRKRLPSGRESYLEQMVRLAVADRPDVVASRSSGLGARAAGRVDGHDGDR